MTSGLLNPAPPECGLSTALTAWTIVLCRGEKLKRRDSSYSLTVGHDHISDTVVHRGAVAWNGSTRLTRRLVGFMVTPWPTTLGSMPAMTAGAGWSGPAAAESLGVSSQASSLSVGRSRTCCSALAVL